jgi:hypothetical protein
MREIAQAAAAVFLLHRDAEQAELAHLRPEVARELVVRSISAARGAIGYVFGIMRPD